jgi:hypothetical protein
LEHVIAAKVTSHSGNVGIRIVDMQHWLLLAWFLAQGSIAQPKAARFDQ